MANYGTLSIASALHAMRSLGYVDRDVLRSGLQGALDAARDDRTWFDRLLRRPKYNAELPDGLTALTLDPNIETLDQLREALDRFPIREAAQNAIGGYLARTGYIDHGLPITRFSQHQYLQLLSGVMARHAYGNRGAIEIEEVFKTLEFSGVYQVFTQNYEARWFNSSLFIYQLGSTARRLPILIELHHTGEYVTARAGVTAPSHDIAMHLLSDRYDADWMHAIIRATLHASDEDELEIRLDDAARPSNQVRILQAHDIACYHLNYSGQSVRGRFQRGRSAGLVSGYKLKPSEINPSILTKVGRFSDPQDDRLSEQDRIVIGDIANATFDHPAEEATPPHASSAAIDEKTPSDER